MKLEDKYVEKKNGDETEKWSKSTNFKNLQ